MDAELITRIFTGIGVIIAAIGSAYGGIVYQKTKAQKELSQLKEQNEKCDTCKEHADIVKKVDLIPDIKENVAEIKSDFKEFQRSLDRKLDEIFTLIRLHQGDISELKGKLSKG